LVQDPSVAVVVVELQALQEPQDLKEIPGLEV
jgi:hypothetical protein